MYTLIIAIFTKYETNMKEIRPDPSNQEVKVQSVKTKRERSRFLIISLVVLVVIFLVTIRVLVLENQKLKRSLVEQKEKPAEATPTKNQISGPSDQAKALCDLGYQIINGNVILKYRDQYFSESIDYPPIKLQSSNVNVVNNELICIMDTPKDVEAMYDELFSFKVFPDKQKFVYVMRWSLQEVEENRVNLFLPVFIYDISSKKNRQILSFRPYTSGQEKVYSFPHVESISSDNKHIAFTMHGCWDCGGHQPETLLYSVNEGQTRNIGKVIDFKWLKSGVYQYKDYVVISCEEPGPGECFKKAEDLPVKSGRM